MKPILKILISLFVLSFSLTACNEDDIQESHYMGVWRINRYNISGYDNTQGYIETHKDYSIYVKPDHIFSETWIENDGARNISGKWDIADNGKNIILKDEQYGERTYDLNYMYTLRLKKGQEEWILRKI